MMLMLMLLVLGDLALEAVVAADIAIYFGPAARTGHESANTTT